MAYTITPKQYVIGPAMIYYRAAAVNTPWTWLGATLDAVVFRLVATWFRPDNLTGVMGPVKGLDVLRKINAEAEFTVPDLGATNLDLSFPGHRSTAEVHAVVGGGLSTTLSSIALQGATTIALTAATNLVVGDYISIAGANGVEYRQVTDIQTLNISFRDPLLVDHASGQAVVETSGDYRTRMRAPTTQRLADSAYREWAVVSSNGNGYHELRLPLGVSESDGGEISVTGDSLSGLRFKIAGRYDPADLTTSPYDLFAPSNTLS